MLPSQPGMVYVWTRERVYLHVGAQHRRRVSSLRGSMRVSVLDALSLEGVSNRLWAGSRNGMISAYDVSQKPP